LAELEEKKQAFYENKKEESEYIPDDMLLNPQSYKKPDYNEQIKKARRKIKDRL